MSWERASTNSLSVPIQGCESLHHFVPTLDIESSDGKRFAHPVWSKRLFFTNFFHLVRVLGIREAKGRKTILDEMGVEP